MLIKVHMKSPHNLPSHFPKPKKEESEFGKGKKDLLICKECNAVYFYKSWHHRLEDYPYLKKTKNLKFTFCPACQMIKEKKFEGEVIVKNVSSKVKANLINLIKNFGKEAFKKDPQDRVISIIDNGSQLRILTTENQLAQRLGKKISQVFKGRLSVSHSKGESTLRAQVIL